LNVGLKALLDGQIDVALRSRNALSANSVKNWRSHRAAAIHTLIKTCLCRARHKPARLPDHPANKLVDLVPWNLRPARQQSAVAA